MLKDEKALEADLGNDKVLVWSFIFLQYPAGAGGLLWCADEK